MPQKSIDVSAPIFGDESLIAFFEFELNSPRVKGLCRLAKSKSTKGPTRLGLTFLSDAEGPRHQELLEKLLSKLSIDDFQPLIPRLQSMVGTTLTLQRQENHVYQIDFVFPEDYSVQARDLLPKMMLVLRKSLYLRTSRPKWWGAPSSHLPQSN